MRVFDTVYDADGKEQRVLNKQETAIAQDKQDIIKAQFADWIWKDPARRDRLCELYNSRFNSIRPREYDGQHIRFPGMNPEIKLDLHQVNAVARYLYGGNALFGHVVGAGKSYEMIAAGMEAKRLRLCNKPMYVVPNNIVADFAGDFYDIRNCMLPVRIGADYVFPGTVFQEIQKAGLERGAFSFILGVRKNKTA